MFQVDAYLGVDRVERINFLETCFKVIRVELGNIVKTFLIGGNSCRASGYQRRVCEVIRVEHWTHLVLTW